MKKLLLVVLIVLVASSAFAQLQLEADFGYFFNSDNYDGVKRSFNGIDLIITPRYFFTENIGLFFAGDFKAWFSANNDEYADMFKSAGMTVTIDDTIGFKLDLAFGLAFAYPVNDKFGLQSDLGVSFTVLIYEGITGDVSYLGSTMSFGIFPDKVKSMGFYANVFGRYLVMEDKTGKGYLTFGAKIDYKFTREESGRVVVSGISQKYSGKENNFSGFSIAPFIGFLAIF